MNPDDKVASRVFAFHSANFWQALTERGSDLPHAVANCAMGGSFSMQNPTGRDYILNFKRPLISPLKMQLIAQLRVASP